MNIINSDVNAVDIDYDEMIPTNGLDEVYGVNKQ